MSTLVAHHPVHHAQHTTPIRVLDFVVVALFAVALAFAARSDMQPEPTNSVYSPTP